jgi:hypothetical protein
MSLVDLQRAAVELCCGPEPAAAQVAAVGDDERIWRLYRELIRKRLLGELKIALPRTQAAAGAEAFASAFEHHLQFDPPRTRFFHALVGAFARSAVPRFRAEGSLAPWLADLCEYEAALWAVADLDDRAVSPAAEFAFDRPALLAPALRLLAVRFPVHTTEPANGYAPGEFYLCVHRRLDQTKARTWTLNAVSFALMRRFVAAPDEIVSEAIRHVAMERGLTVDSSFIDGLCTVLANFIERGILLGSR